MSDLTFSIVIPTYNRAELLKRALVSVVRELEPGDEIIVVDDGSIDNTESVVRSFDANIRYIKRSHSGAGATRNAGLAAARKPLIAFLDSDDEWMPGKLAIQRQVMAKCPGIAYCFTDFAIKKVDKREYRFALKTWHFGFPLLTELLRRGGSFSEMAELPPGQSDFDYYVGNLYLAELKANYVAVPTLVVRREAAAETIGFAEDTPTYEDWQFVGSLARGTEGMFLNCETNWQHGHAGERLTDATAFDAATARFKIVKRVWGVDQPFLERHAAEYNAVLDRLHEIRLRSLLARLKVEAARDELKQMTVRPLFWRLILSMPAGLTRLLLSARKRVKHLLSGSVNRS
jgi:glycosyltransferase involved in cell wall biosynthesis